MKKRNARAPLGGGDRLHPALEAALRGEEDEDVADEPTEDADGAPPRVVIARLADLAVAGAPAAQADRPVWFVLEDDADAVELFSRLPEAPLPRPATQAVFAALRSFAADKTDALQEVLGVTDSIEIGFHASADLEDVAASFEEDGFDVILGAIEGGKLLER